MRESDFLNDLEASYETERIRSVEEKLGRISKSLAEIRISHDDNHRGIGRMSDK